MADFSVQNPQVSNPYPLPTPNLQPVNMFKALNLDNVFNQAIQYKLAQQEMAKNQIALDNARTQQNLQFGAYGFTPQDVTPENLQAARAPQQIQPQPGMGQGMWSAPGQAQAQAEPPQIAGLRAYLAMQQRMAGLGARLTESEAARNEADAAEKNYWLNLLGAGNGGGNNFITSTIDQVERGLLDPSGVFDAAGRDPRARMAMQQEMNRRGLDQNKLQIAYDSRKSYETSKASSLGNVQGGTLQKLGTAAGVLEDILNKAEPLIAKLNTHQIATLNKAFLAGKLENNDPDVREAFTLLTEGRGKYATVLAQGETAQAPQLDEAAKTISNGLSDRGFKGMKAGVEFAASRTVKRMGGAGYNEAPPAEQKKTRHDWSGGNTVTYSDGSKGRWNGKFWEKIP